MKILNVDKNNVLYNIDSPISYPPSLFSQEIAENGSETTISVVGSGLPTYKGFENLGDFDVVTDDTDSPYDKLGCTTALGGFIGANGKYSITGMSPFSKILCVKAFNDSGNGGTSEIVAAILWSIVKDVDAIVLPFEIDPKSSIVMDAIKKAFDNKIIVLSLPFTGSKKIKEIITVDYDTDSKMRIGFTGNNINVFLPKLNQISAYGSSHFVKASKQISSLGLASGLVSCLISKAKNAKKSSINKAVVEELKRISS